MGKNQKDDTKTPELFTSLDEADLKDYTFQRRLVEQNAISSAGARDVWNLLELRYNQCIEDAVREHFQGQGQGKPSAAEDTSKKGGLFGSDEDFAAEQRATQAANQTVKQLKGKPLLNVVVQVEIKNGEGGEQQHTVRLVKQMNRGRVFLMVHQDDLLIVKALAQQKVAEGEQSIASQYRPNGSRRGGGGWER